MSCKSVGNNVSILIIWSKQILPLLDPRLSPRSKIIWVSLGAMDIHWPLSRALRWDSEKKIKQRQKARLEKIPISGRKLERQPQTVNKSVKREWMFVGGRNPTKKPAGRKESFPRDSRITSGLSRSKTSLSRPFRVLASGPIQAPSTGNRTSRHVPLFSRVFQLLRFFAHRMETSKKRCLNVWWRRKKMINSDNTKLGEKFFLRAILNWIFRFIKITRWS